MQTLMQDLRYGVRNLLKNPSFTLISVFTLALGIGANSAIFSVVHAVLLKPFSYSEPEQLVVAWERALGQGLSRMVVSPPNFSDWRQQNQSFQDMAAYKLQDFNLVGDPPERVRGVRVSATMFSLLGVRPALGRNFHAYEDEPGAPAAVIISYALWQRRFGGSLTAIGQSIALGTESATVIGIMPEDFDFPPPITYRGEAHPAKVELWTQLRYSLEDQRGAHNLFVLARLKPGISIEHAEGDLRHITQRLANDYPGTNAGWDAFLVPFHQQVVGDVKTALLLLPAAVLLVLLIACANVANLLLVRATRRQREFAIRASLGAGRFRLIRQMLIENILLSLVGGMAGLVLAAWALKLITALAPQNVYRLATVKLDVRVILFGVLLSLLTALLFGLVPAWHNSKIDLVAALKEGGTTVSDGAARQGLRNALVIAEVALALLLLTGAGLLIRSFWRLQTVPTGFQPDHLTAMTINIPRSSYREDRQRVAFTERVLAKVASLPIAESVAFSDNLPLDVGGQGTDFRIEGQPVSRGSEPHARVTIVSPGYFQAMGIPLLRGRDFSAADNAESRGVVIISNDLATKYFANQNPVGRRLDMGFRTGNLLEIVGVAADERQDQLQADLSPGTYLPYSQYPSPLPLILLIRSKADATTVASLVREQMREVDPQLPVYDVKTMNQVLYTAMARPRFVAYLLSAFAVVAMLLAAVGIYGVMSYTVTQNTREIGIRMALGAQASNVVTLIVGQGLVLAVLGIAIGLFGAIALTRFIMTLLYGISPTDPMTLVGVSALLMLVALLACYLPARRATKVDPIVALRHE